MLVDNGVTEEAIVTAGIGTRGQNLACCMTLRALLIKPDGFLDIARNR